MAPSNSTGPWATRASNSCFVTVTTSRPFYTSISPSPPKYKGPNLPHCMKRMGSAWNVSPLWTFGMKIFLAFLNIPDTMTL